MSVSGLGDNVVPSSIGCYGQSLACLLPKPLAVWVVLFFRKRKLDEAAS